MRSASFGGVYVSDICVSQRQSFAGRISHRVASELSFANPSFREARSGTVIGTTINTLCSVIGAGVLSLPLAMCYSSVFVGLGLLLLLSFFAAFSVYLLVVGCNATGRYSITEVVAFALYPPQLWEEFLYQKGNERSSLPLTAAKGSGAAALALRPHCGNEEYSHNSTCVNNNAKGDRAASAASVSLNEELLTTTVDWSSETMRSQRHPRRNGHNAHGNPSVEGAPAESDDGGYDQHCAFLPTSAYAGLRDAYARQEWHHRRCRRIVTVLMELVVFCSNYGTLVIYSKVIADSMPPVVSYITHSNGILVTRSFWFAASGVVFFLLSCSRNMEELKWSSLLGFFTIFYIVLLILYRYHTQRVNDYPHVDPSKYGSIHWMRFSVKVLQTVSTFGLAFSYHYNVPYFYKELQDRRPRRMMESVVIAFPIIIACYALTGVFGYLTFGNEVVDKGVGGNIVSNYPKDDFPMNIGRLGLFAHFACVFPVVSICTRRGLHRLTMVGLTWAEQSALMRAAAVAEGAILTEEEKAATACRSGGTPGSVEIATVAAGETSPLLYMGNTTTTGARYPPSYGAVSRISPQQNISYLAGVAGGSGAKATVTIEANAITGIARGSSPATVKVVGGGRAYNSFSSSSSNAEEEHVYLTRCGGLSGTVDVDRDVGSPDVTTNLAIVLEAAFLVCTTVLIAGMVSGIDSVIHVIGTLFSVFIVMVAPGMVGWCVFSPNGPFGSAKAAATACAMQREHLGVGGGVASSDNVRGLDNTINGAAPRYCFIRLKLVICVVNAVVGLCITCIGIAVLIYDTARGYWMPVMQA